MKLTEEQQNFKNEYFSEDSAISEKIYDEARNLTEKSLKKNKKYQDLLKKHKEKTYDRGIFCSTEEAEEAHKIAMNEELKITEKLIKKKIKALNK